MTDDPAPVEEERKFQATVSFVLPELAGCLPPGGRITAEPPVTLTATYYDTAELRLARAGVTLRHRVGDQPPWTVKLPVGTPGIRHEISRAGPETDPPAELVSLTTVYHRGAPLAPVVTVRTVRRAYRLHDAGGRVLAEVADDDVATDRGEEFREIEVERRAGDRALLDRITVRLTASGAVAGDFVPKHVRALGPAAAAPPDLVPADPLPPQPRAADVVALAIRSAVARIARHDPLLRLRVPLPDGDTPVHQLRVACRRLRSDLRTFADLLDPTWSAGVVRELRWFAGTLADARDYEVLRERLQRTAGADPLAPVSGRAVRRIDRELARRQAAGLTAAADAAASRRYHRLLDALVDAAARPRFTHLAAASAREVLPHLVAVPWYRLVHGGPKGAGAGALTADAPDTVWHQVRIDGKRARYAVEAAASVIGEPARQLGRRLARVQELLGEHQDAAIAADTWLTVARGQPERHRLAVTAGRLYEREREAIRAVRADFPAAWRKATRPRCLTWLP